MLDLEMSSTRVVGMVFLAGIFVLIQRLSTPRLEPSEPPLLKPRIPLVGHIVGLLWHRMSYFQIINKRKPMPVATLPILHNKVYAIWSPDLVQSALRNKQMTFDPFMLDFSKTALGLSDHSMAALEGDGGLDESLNSETITAMKVAMTGQNLYRTNVNALGSIKSRLNVINEEGITIPNLYLWLRELMTQATVEALYGEANPMKHDPSLIDALWGFETNLMPLMIGVLPGIFARVASRHRARLQNALYKYYNARLDEKPDVAQVTKARINLLREHGFSMAEAAKAELALPFVATTNTIPITYWMTAWIWLDRDLVQCIRDEVTQIIALVDGGDRADDTAASGRKFRRRATLDITQLEEKCPLLVSCYRETMRIGNQLIGTRRVMQDTVLTDADGRSYLFKKGYDVVWSGKYLHRQQDTWGKDAEDFSGARFMAAKLPDDLQKKKKASYVPFGGGKHLCPGRNLAFAEILGFTAAMVVGYELDWLDKANSRSPTAFLVGAIAKPSPGEEGSATLKRREGWQDVQWDFAC
ncbi:uncharacterized protein E0L32_011055 [Thyridium curvatum]|uniref:Cytochrome P450 n=1 Tax=Thyridium curvatum TaxID=1093900 RepID=A0A507AJN3_9PEZI|nr:uncharacterized protein E0L32_011055 [Thyridium curvatum]TPX07067.1 hypothetical protein E0L32_011055 [Thyridium curvatum]